MNAPVITPELVCRLTDIDTAAILAVVGDPLIMGHGCDVAIEDDFGFSRHVREYEKEILHTHDFAIMRSLGHDAHELTKRCAGWHLVKTMLYKHVMNLSAACAHSPTPCHSLPQYLTHFNIGAGGPYRCLVSPEYATLWHKCYQRPSPRPDAVSVSPLKSGVPRVRYDLDSHNVYAPEAPLAHRKMSALYPDSLTRVDLEQYAGAGALELACYGIEIGGTVMVEGEGRLRDGAVRPRRVWTAVIQPGDSSVVLVPEVGGDLCVSVTSIVVPPGSGAGEVFVRAVRPRAINAD